MTHRITMCHTSHKMEIRQQSKKIKILTIISIYNQFENIDHQQGKICRMIAFA